MGAPVSFFLRWDATHENGLSSALVLISILGAVALAHVTGLVNPHEKVHGLWLAVAVACI